MVSLKTEKSGKEILSYLIDMSLAKTGLDLISWTSDLHKANNILKWLFTRCQQNLYICLLTVQKPVFACEEYKIYL